MAALIASDVILFLLLCYCTNCCLSRTRDPADTAPVALVDINEELDPESNAECPTSGGSKPSSTSS